MTEEKNVPPTADAEGQATLATALDESLKREKAKRFRKGERVRGRVFKIGETMAFVDLGGKSEGMLDLSELRRSDGTLELEENEEIEGIVVDVAANGVLLRKALIAADESFEQIKAAHQAGITVQARVLAFNKGGLELDLFGLRAFCPASQVDVRKQDDLSPYVGQTFEFRIIEVKDAGKKVVLSRRALMSEEYEKVLAEIRAKITPGAVLGGKVTRVQPFGAFVDLGEGIEGLVHLTELTRARITNPADVVQPGQEVQVQVLKVDETTDKKGGKVERIALSMKALEKDPWQGAGEQFPVGAKVPGKVLRLQPFGAFVEVAPGVEGLVHISEISEKRLTHPNEAIKEGEDVEVHVLAVEPERKRLSLSIRGPRQPKERPPREARPPRRERTERPPREGQGERPHYAVGSVHDATVERVEPFGVFVALPGGGTALVPNSELGVVKNADQKIDYRKVFPVGTAIRVAVVGTDRQGKLKASKLEAERADERAMVKEWSQSQKPAAGGRGFGTFADLLRKANVVK